MLRTLAITALALAVILFFAGKRNTNSSPEKAKKWEKVRGVNFVSPVNKIDRNNTGSVKRIGADWIALTPFAFMKPGIPTIEYDIALNWWGDTPEGIQTLARYAKENQLKVLLKPHFWVEGQGWAGEYDLSEEGWQEWEKNYEAFILRLAGMAKDLELDMFCIGTELKTSISKRPKFWLRLIKKVREVYPGPLTYAANWDNYYNIQFWNKLDYIGVDAYFPLVEASTPSIDEMKKEWGQRSYLLRRISDKYKTPILFTEYGYRSINRTAWRQWEIEGVDSETDINLQAQINAYEALYQTFWDKEWFAGGFIWKWWEFDTKAGGENNSDYTPQNKPVERTIKAWYSR